MNPSKTVTVTFGSGSPLRIATRGSRLALWQAEHITSLLGVPTEFRIVKTSGDRFLDVALQGQVDKGFFTKEIEEILLAGEADLAIHSLKDLPTEIPEGLCLGAIPERGPTGDVLLVHPDFVDRDRPFPVKEGALVGASALRRQSLLKRYRPDLRTGLLRGNVPTRIDKCRRGEFGAIVGARAGLARLELDVTPLIAFDLDEELWLPAPGQAALGVEAKSTNTDLLELLAGIDHAETRSCVQIERGLLARFEGGCHAAFGASARRAPGGGFIVRVGMEHPEHVWQQVEVSASREDEAVDVAYEKLIASGAPFPKLEDDSWQTRLCSPAAPWC